MALRGDYIQLKTNAALGSGQSEVVIAESTSVTIDFSAEALETTSQSDGLNATFIAGKVTATASGDFLVASNAANLTGLFTQMNAGTTIDVTVYNDSTRIFEGEGVITSLSVTGGNSDQLATGSYSIQLSGNMSTS